MITLTILANKLTLQLPKQTCEINLSLENLTKILSPNSQLPPSEIAWEEAIMTVEDAISYLRDDLITFDEMQVSGADELKVLVFAEDDNSDYILAETLEKAFAVLAGYRMARDLPDLPQTADFYAKVLLLREWVHHLNFDKVYIK